MKSTKQRQKLHTYYAEMIWSWLLNHRKKFKKKIQTVKIFSDDINMEFGLEKCAKITFKRGKLTHLHNLVIDNNREIQELNREKRTNT